MINIIVGPLNRLGTQARTIGRIAADKMDITNRYAIAIDAITANSQEAMIIIDKLEKRRATKGIGPIRVPKDMYDELFSLGIRIGRYAQADRQDVYNTWDESLVSGAETLDTAIDDVRSTTKKVVDKTGEYLGNVFPILQ